MFTVLIIGTNSVFAQNLCYGCNAPDISKELKIAHEKILSILGKPPLEQLKAGIAIQDIKCKESFVLLIKESSENPACVKPTTATKLLSHGWLTVEKFETTHQTRPQNENTVSINNKSASTLHKPLSEMTDSTGWAGKITFLLNENSTSLNVTRGSSVSGIIPLNIVNNATMKFFVDDEGQGNDTRRLLPSGVTVSMLAYGKQYHPEFMSQIRGMASSNNTFIPTVVGQTSVPYIISVSNDVPPGTYHFNIICSSYLKISDLEAKSSTLVYHYPNGSSITITPVEDKLHLDEIKLYVVILNVT